MKTFLAVVGAIWIVTVLLFVAAIGIYAFRLRRRAQPYADEMQEYQGDGRAA